MPIYQSLFKYRERASRSPREDFLSEALTDLLNRMPEQEVLRAIDQFFLSSGPLRADWKEYLERNPGSNLRWETQQQIYFEGIAARLDIILRSNDDILFVIENKIDAHFQSHTISPEVANEQVQPNYRHQLATYGCWLAAKCTEQQWKGGLVLLTHRAQTPANFASDTAEYGVACRTVLKWTDVSRWLSNYRQRLLALERKDQKDQSAWLVLAAELAQLLEEWDMSTELMTSYDLATAEIFAQSSDRLSAAFDRIYDSILKGFEGLSVNRLPKLTPHRRPILTPSCGGVCW
jgi:hypothetical protein